MRTVRTVIYAHVLILREGASFEGGKCSPRDPVGAGRPARQAAGGTTRMLLAKMLKSGDVEKHMDGRYETPVLI